MDERLQRKFRHRTSFYHALQLVDNNPVRGRRVISYGIIWRIQLMRVRDELWIKYSSQSSKEYRIMFNVKWNIASRSYVQTRREHVNEKFPDSKNVIIPWSSVAGLLENNTLKITVSVEIISIQGMKQKLKCFDHPNPSLSDFVIKTRGQKFHISRMYLTGHCKNLYAILNRSVYWLLHNEYHNDDLDPEVLQDFLEVLYLKHDAIMSHNVVAILQLADYWGAPAVIRHCELYLIKSAFEMHKRSKLEIAYRFKLIDLESSCIEKITDQSILEDVLQDHDRNLSDRAKEELKKKAKDLGVVYPK